MLIDGGECWRVVYKWSNMRVNMFTQAFVMWAMIIGVQSSNPRYLTPVVSCHNCTSAVECDYQYLRLSAERRCQDEVLNCIYEANGKCYEGCTPDCPSVTINGNTLVVLWRLPSGTCSLKISISNSSGVVVAEATTTCGSASTCDAEAGGWDTSCKPTMGALMMRPLQHLLIVLCTLVYI